MAFNFSAEHEQGDFNSGLAIIYRLDAIHKQLHVSRDIKQFEEYYKGLIALYVELSRVMKEEERKDHLKLWDKVKVDYFELRKRVREKKPVSATLLESFYYWELQLTDIEQSKAMGMPKKKDARYALSN